ncbi:hypothetical protein E2C01_046039 [Portunus trituberculatus]|uniref:Uncharacterized protein n=1 Tax=Portunus trituberculatus TaxID=210409 RepID=A0A5B7G3J6_PORTR|nr:hypothetical protein [Portunus trituberculatus]
MKTYTKPGPSGSSDNNNNKQSDSTSTSLISPSNKCQYNMQHSPISATVRCQGVGQVSAASLTPTEICYNDFPPLPISPVRLSAAQPNQDDYTWSTLSSMTIP